MDIVAIIVAAALAALLVTRELMWRRAFGVMRAEIAAGGREQAQLARVGHLVSGLAQELKSPLQGAIELDDRTAANLDELDEPTWSGDLVACRQIVQAHGGSLEVERPANGGSRFHLELPVTAGRSDAPIVIATS